MVMKMLTEVTREIYMNKVRISTKSLESRNKQTKNQAEIIKLKNRITKLKIQYKVCKARLHPAEKRISELENMSFESPNQRNRNTNKNSEHI